MTQREEFMELEDELREADRAFRRNLIIYSGGAISLSIAFLGYLASGTDVVLGPLWLLYTSWALLVISAILVVVGEWWRLSWIQVQIAEPYYKRLVARCENMEELKLKAQEHLRRIRRKEGAIRVFWWLPAPAVPLFVFGIAALVLYALLVSVANFGFN